MEQVPDPPSLRSTCSEGAHELPLQPLSQPIEPALPVDKVEHCV